MCRMRAATKLRGRSHESWKQARWPFVVFVLIASGHFRIRQRCDEVSPDSTPLWCLAVRFGGHGSIRPLLRASHHRAASRREGAGCGLPQALCMGISYLCCNVALDATTATNVGFLVVALPVVFAPLLSTVVERSLPARHHSLSGGVAAACAFCAARVAVSPWGQASFWL